MIRKNMGTRHFLFLVLLGSSITSCVGDCYCTKDLGCKVLTVKKLNVLATNVVVLTQTFCSQVDFHTDLALIDSVAAFQKRYTTDSTFVDIKDSIFKHYEPVSVKRDVNRYTNNGYWCNCPR